MSVFSKFFPILLGLVLFSALQAKADSSETITPYESFDDTPVVGRASVFDNSLDPKMRIGLGGIRSYGGVIAIEAEATKEIAKHQINDELVRGQLIRFFTGVRLGLGQEVLPAAKAGIDIMINHDRAEYDDELAESADIITAYFDRNTPLNRDGKFAVGYLKRHRKEHELKGHRMNYGVEAGIVNSGDKTRPLGVLVGDLSGHSCIRMNEVYSFCFRGGLGANIGILQYGVDVQGGVDVTAKISDNPAANFHKISVGPTISASSEVDSDAQHSTTESVFAVTIH